MSVLNPIAAAFSLWGDSLSRRTFLQQVDLRIGGESHVVLPQAQPNQYFPESVYRYNPNEVFVDCGAFDGDTFAELTGKGPFSRYIGFEPDVRNFEALVQRCGRIQSQGIDAARVRLVNAAVADSFGRRPFNALGGTGSHFDEAGGVTVEAVTLDAALAHESPTFLKMDIEGAEPLAIAGAAETIRRCRPMMALCVYHQPEHLWEIPLQVAAILGDAADGYRFHLRHHGTAHWEAVFYASPPDRHAAQ